MPPLVIIAVVVRKIRNERSAEADVEKLHPAANRQRWQRSLEDLVDDRALAIVALRHREPAQSLRILKSVAQRIDVGAAGEHDPVDALQRLGIERLVDGRQPNRIDPIAEPFARSFQRRSIEGILRRPLIVAQSDLHVVPLRSLRADLPVPRGTSTGTIGGSTWNIGLRAPQRVPRGTCQSLRVPEVGAQPVEGPRLRLTVLRGPSTTLTALYAQDDKSSPYAAVVRGRYRARTLGVTRACTIERMYRPHPLDEKLAAVLPAGSLFAVGGRVRDEIRSELLGETLPIKDLDYVVAGVAVRRVFGCALAPLGRVDVVGAAFAVIKLTLDGETVDVGLPRRERSTGQRTPRLRGHRAGPTFPLDDDLARRDFRMNMIARALPAGELVDPVRRRSRHPRPADRHPHRRRRSTKIRCACCAPRSLPRASSYELTPTTRAAMTAAAPLVATVSAERDRTTS